MEASVMRRPGQFSDSLRAIGGLLDEREAREAEPDPGSAVSTGVPAFTESSLLRKITSRLVAVLRARQRTTARQQIAALRLELSGMQEGPKRARRAQKTRPPMPSAQEFRRSILRADKQANLEAALDRAVKLGLNPEDASIAPSSTTARLDAKATANRKSVVRMHWKKACGAATLLSVLVALGATRLTVADWAVASTTRDSGPNTVIELAPSIRALAVEPGKMFFTQQIPLEYTEGRVVLSGAATPMGPFSVDDAMTIAVSRPDGSRSTWAHTFNTDCYSNSLIDAQDLTWMFLPGINIVQVELSDVCGATWGTSGSIVLTQERA
jgi:hypothetical protein